ncbi:MAG TPA: transporter substrate-binding domain-containing protein [Candidatus Limnocylindrales bacterium]|nr:transporter substrate-binding domain-containing protein [Candidatus Limnocylindrales bacterium]
MRRALPVTALLASLLLAACTGGGATTAPGSAAPSVAAPSASTAASVAPSPSADACAKDALTTKTAGKLTIGTDNPAYPPYFQIPSGTATAPWELGDPTNGEGFEGAFAYALAEKLGFAKADVVWIVVPFDNSFAPGEKAFDLDINQVSYKAERAQAVDLSDGYYTLNQSVVALKANGLASVTSIAAMKAFKFGAQVGTTSLDTINTVIAPTAAAMVYNTNDDAIAALKAKQIDGLVVDLPTAFYVTAAQVEDSVIVGQFAPPTGADAEHFSVVLAKGSALTACVNAAIAAMKSEGSLDAITKEWLSDKASAPVLAP